MMSGMTTDTAKRTAAAAARDYGNEPPAADEYLSVTIVEARNLPTEDLVRDEEEEGALTVLDRSRDAAPS